MKYKYKTIDTRTQKGLTQVNMLLSRDWKIGTLGFWSVQLYKSIKSKRK